MNSSGYLNSINGKQQHQQQQQQQPEHLNQVHQQASSPNISFTPSPILYMSPMAPIDYGYPDDILDDGRSDGPDSPTLISSSFMNDQSNQLVPDLSVNNNCRLDPKHGVYTFQGTRRYMEDRHKIKSSLDNNPNISLYGVFDGHGGHTCANFVQKRISQYINKFIKENSTGYSSKNSPGCSAKGIAAGAPDSPLWKKVNSLRSEQQNETQNRSDMLQTALYKTFTVLDQRFSKKYRSKNESGTTCLVALLSTPPSAPPLLVVANTGDSRGVLCRSGRAIPLSFDHKPSNPKEKQRIMSAGGKVEWDYNERTWRVGGILSMSRGIGDIPLKKWVVPDPEFVVIPLRVKQQVPATVSKASSFSPLTGSPRFSPKCQRFSSINEFELATRSISENSAQSISEVPDQDQYVAQHPAVTSKMIYQRPTSPKRRNNSQMVVNVSKLARSSSSSINGAGYMSPSSAPQPAPTPLLSSSSIVDIDQYFILATDGIWDVFSNQDLVDFINKTIEEVYTSKSMDWDSFDIAKRVSMEAFARGSGDNSTVIIVKLDT
ncbi:hypothetical protein SAMD00019534_103050 [Acytostelium subglobosum LB1]|uniref:hypothetical protein n=1 Tax=Acytostelium subglobosum LB1 TaxID=1410327 RepID=UPI000644CDA6|nr:hypothetical protein SAMD00019534_103050 [Acytostelium subglobosum LB1]GAM27130.1 hypothetical protein SAMD00019534_103050 [Acytostelium subglobosum LB1]|eukprot:XP_012750010.1 hypothetical protein SAMD00019534_103050 [Acytostelium subglobosum LB1]